jgi:hypothetical protein
MLAAVRFALQVMSVVALLLQLDIDKPEAARARLNPFQCQATGNAGANDVRT